MALAEITLVPLKLKGGFGNGRLLCERCVVTRRRHRCVMIVVFSESESWAWQERENVYEQQERGWFRVGVIFAYYDGKFS